MSLFDKLKNALEDSANLHIKTLPPHIRESLDIAKLYAVYEVREERKRLKKAVDKRIEDGVTPEQLMALSADIRRSFYNVPLLNKQIADLKTKIEEFEEISENPSEKDVKKLELLRKRLDNANNKLEKTLLANKNYESLLAECGIGLEEVTNG